MTTVIDGAGMGLLLMGAYKNLARSAETINALNVFPVPDGDTGTNMSKTLEGGFNAPASSSIAEYMRLFSRNTLMAARGNSGVILSQFIKGFYKGVADSDVMDTDIFSKAMAAGVELAYRAVLNPVEGTMLTVLRDSAQFLCSSADTFDSFEECFAGLVSEMKRSLDATPEKLPVLKEAGVVDSGGAGMLCIFRGMEMALLGEDANEDLSRFSESPAAAPDLSLFSRDSVFEEGYCTEYILQLLSAKCDVSAFDISDLIVKLDAIGSSVVCAREGDAVKVHVHTKCPEKALELGRNYGELLSIKIENMTVQNSALSVGRSDSAKSPKHVKYAVAAVCTGEGIKQYFREIGVSAVIDGGQTHNPSAEDMIAVLGTLNADHIILLPNNKNVILAAKQAAEMYGGADVRVIPTSSVAEGYSALSMMDLDADSVEELIEGMTAGLSRVTTCYVTTATRDASIGGVDIRRGDFIGLDGDSILCAEKTKVDAAATLLSKLEDIDDKEVITVFCGSDVTERDKAELGAIITEKNPLTDCNFIDGGQELYSFIMSVE